MRLPLNVPAQQGLAPEISAGARFNCYLEPGGDFSPETLICRPGLRSALAGAGSGEVRGRAYPFNGEIWFVRGNKVYSFDGSTRTERGTLNTATGYVSFADNGAGIGNQLMLVDGTDGWIWNSDAETFTQITDADFPANPVQVVYLNFFFIVFSGGTQKFFACDTLAGTDWQALRFASAEAVPDDVVAISATKQELILIGERSTEFWTFTGNTDFEFERFQNGVISSGCEAAFSVVEVDNTLSYLENTANGGRRFVRLAGGISQIISPSWLNARLDSMTVSDCFGYAIKFRGHEFVIYQFPTEDQTWVYDAATQLWSRWTFLLTGVDRRFLIDACAYLNGKHYGVDRRNGNIVQIDGDYYSDNGDEISMRWIAGHIQRGGKRIRHSAYQLFMAGGVGEISGETNPLASLAWSDDGGHTWSNEHVREMGAVGEYGKRVRWTRLGSSRDRVYRHIITSSVRRIVLAQEAELAAA